MRSIAQPAIILALATGVCSAHQDSIIEITKDGTLVGLPAQFQPSVLKVLFSSNEHSKHPIKSVSITIGKSTIHLPRAVVELLRSEGPGSIAVSASWYHEASLLPPYMNIEFTDPRFSKNQTGVSGYRMMINLNTGKLFSMASVIVIKPDSSWQHREIKLSTLCTSSELAGFYEPLVFKPRTPK